MLTDDPKRKAHRELVQRILNGTGRASPELRLNAFRNANLPKPLDTLLDKVATGPTQVSDADFAASLAAGFNEDQLFEAVVCAAVGQSSRLYEAGLTALAEALAEMETSG